MKYRRILVTLGACWLTLNLNVCEAQAECQVQVMGKYNAAVLGQQWDYCQGTQCDGCLDTQWPDNWPGFLTPFDTADGDNCNGMVTPSFFEAFFDHYTISLSRRHGTDWVSFTICGEASTLRSTIDECGQNLNTDDMCYHHNDDGSWTTVTGAYLVGSELRLDLDIEYNINFGQLGYPDGIGEGDWTTFRDYVSDAVNDGAMGWNAVYLASLAYMNDSYDYSVITARQPGNPAGDTDKIVGIYDYAWGKKIMAHALCGWQCWEGGQDNIDLWSETRMACIPFVVDKTPSFFYEIAWEYGDLIYLPVRSEDRSWGAIKCQFR